MLKKAPFAFGFYLNPLTTRTKTPQSDGPGVVEGIFAMARRRISFSRALMRLRRIVRNDQLILGMLAVLVGLASGGCIIVFREERE